MAHTSKIDSRHRRRLLILATALALSGILSPVRATADKIHKVLVVHSFHQGLAWTDSISDGIRSVFKPFDKQFELYFEYLDLKRRPQPVCDDALIGYFRSESDFDAVVAADEEAYGFVRRSMEQGGHIVPLIFCGRSQSEPAIDQQGQAVTGVLNTWTHRDNLDLMRDLHKENKRLIVLFDWNAGGAQFQEELAGILSAIPRDLAVELWADQSLDELPAKLQSLDAGDLIYMLAVNRNKNLNYLLSDEAIQLVSRWSPAPIYSPLEVYLGKGIVGGRITSGFNQGELAAQLALRVISGEAVESIPVVTRSPNPYIFDYRQLKRFGLKRASLPPGSVVIEPPEGFLTRWAKHMALIGAAALLVAMVILIGALQLLSKHQAVFQTKCELDNRLKEKSVQLQLVHQKLKKQTLVDPLTGLANRRAILARCADEIKRSQRYGTLFSIALLDLDFFKRINVEFGYAVGDQILKDVAHILRHAVRAIDGVGRFGGESFLILMPNTNQDMALSSAERILAAVAAQRWEKNQVWTTLSIGLIQYRGEELSELTAKAEGLQQQAKAQGGNQIMIANS